MKHLLAILLFITSLLNGTRAQTTIIEELKQRISTAENQEKRLNATLLLCEQGYSLHPDTLMQYAITAATIADKLRDFHKYTTARYYQSFALTNNGLIDSSLSIIEECLGGIPSRIKNPALEANLLNQKGRCFMRSNQYKEAIQMGLRVIDISEKSGDTLLQIKGKTLIGWAYLEMGQPREALKWHLRALHTTDNKNLLDEYGILYANIALNYRGLEQVDSAFYFINKAIAASRNYENLFALSNSLAIKSQLLVFAGRAQEAEAPLTEVVAIRKLIGDPFYITSDMAQLAYYYAHNSQPAKGLQISKEGIEIAKKFGLDTKLFFLYGALAENYKMAGDNRKYAAILEEIIQLKDSVYQQNTAREMAEMQTKYNLQKKENLIIRQQIDIARQQYSFWGLLTFIFLLTIIAFLLFREYKRKHLIKMKIMKREEQRLKEEAIVKAEEKERKRIAADLHDNMGAYASAILAGVEELYAVKNKPGKQMLESMKGNAENIMIDLRDTIWVLDKDVISITNISDRFKNYVQKISPSYPEISINIKEEIISDELLSPQIALNMLRIMQEAFHNAIKHSNGSIINIHIGYNHGPQVQIKDNGAGIDELKRNLNGKGFYNMQARAKASGWKLIINDNIPSGTIVEINS